MKQYVYGADVGGTNIKLGIFELPQVSLIKLVEFKTPEVNQETEIRDQIFNHIQILNAAFNIDMSDVKGLGIAIPCPVQNGYVTKCANVGWSNFDIKKSFQEKFPSHMNIQVANDASMAAYGENRASDKSYKNAIFYTLGTGVGGGIISDGKILEGKHGVASEFGHIKVFAGFEDETCGCGFNGCLEQIAGTKGIFRLMRQYSTYENTVVDLENLTVKDIFDAAKLGDAPALKTVERVADVLGENAALLALVLDPEVFIIGGGIAAAGDFLLSKIVNSYQRNAKFTTKDTPFILAKLKNKAGAFGAAHLVNDSIK